MTSSSNLQQHLLYCPKSCVCFEPLALKHGSELVFRDLSWTFILSAQVDGRELDCWGCLFCVWLNRFDRLSITYFYLFVFRRGDVYCMNSVGQLYVVAENSIWLGPCRLAAA